MVEQKMELKIKMMERLKWLASVLWCKNPDCSYHEIKNSKMDHFVNIVLQRSECLLAVMLLATHSYSTSCCCYQSLSHPLSETSITL